MNIDLSKISPATLAQIRRQAPVLHHHAERGPEGRYAAILFSPTNRGGLRRLIATSYIFPSQDTALGHLRHLIQVAGMRRTQPYSPEKHGLA